jgi:hypothetical protein
MAAVSLAPAGFGAKRSQVQILSPRLRFTWSEQFGDQGTCPERRVQQRSTAVRRSPERLPQPAQGLLGRLRAGLGVCLDRHRLVGMAKNPHHDPRVHNKMDQQRRTRRRASCTVSRRTLAASQRPVNRRFSVRGTKTIEPSAVLAAFSPFSPPGAETPWPSGGRFQRDAPAMENSSMSGSRVSGFVRKACRRS